VALTNADLKSAVERRAFRDDLFYRLNVVHIIVPPLRERDKDLETLGRIFVQAYAAKHGRPAKKLSAEALALLRAYDFPGNVREFGNIIERAVIVSNDTQIAVEDLPEGLRAAAQQRAQRDRKPTLAEIESEYIRESSPRRRETRPKRRGYSASAARIFTSGWPGRDQRSEIRSQRPEVRC
jgi:transcriptional regulator with PAS, ATPase and Fis domain